MSNNNSDNSSGIGLLGLLTVLFIGLRLTGFINWSWLWILSPLWIPIVILLVIFIVCSLIVGIMEIIEAYRKDK